MDGRLRRIIGDLLLGIVRDIGRDRADIDDRAAALFEHGLDRGARDAEGRDQIRVHDEGEALVVEVMEIAIGCDAGIVDENIEPAELFDRRIHDRIRRLRIDQIRFDPGASLGVRREQLVQLRRPASARQHQRRARLGEQLCNGKADTAIAAGDQGDLAVDAELFESHVSPPRV